MTDKRQENNVMKTLADFLQERNRHLPDWIVHLSSIKAKANKTHIREISSTQRSILSLPLSSTISVLGPAL
jgi:succinate dehydrogenase flavin-adding protein (antitoxin of CptAB toxin-antitoxin module)